MIYKGNLRLSVHVAHIKYVYRRVQCTCLNQGKFRGVIRLITYNPVW